MKLNRAFVSAFGVEANTVDFMRKVRGLLKLEGIDPATAEAKNLRYNCVEVWGGNPEKVVHISRPHTLLQVVARPQQPRSSNKVTPLDRGANG